MTDRLPILDTDTPLVQIAGIIDAAEARMVCECGAEALGFPLRLGDGREDISEEGARAVIASLPRTVCGVVITYLDRAEEIVALCRKLGARAVQLHGGITPEEIRSLRRAAPDLFVIKSLIVRVGDASALLAELEQKSPFVDAFLTDTHDPDTGRTGATGLPHDWSVSRRLVERSARPVILAGGLSPDNVAEAIRAVRPWGVDAHTRVEDETGRKDRRLVEKFVSEARAAFDSLDSRR
jgi:phosphoribosylanthranilate isomerase